MPINITLSSSKFNATFSVLRRITFLMTASNEPSPVTTEQIKLWLIIEMNRNPQSFSPYEVFSGKFQSAHFVFCRNVKLRGSWALLHSIPIDLSSFAVVLVPPGDFIASYDPVSSSFLKMLWIILLDFPTVFEISPIESLCSLRNLTISFLSYSDVIDFFAMFKMQESVKSRCNLIKYPIFYSYPKCFNAK